MYASQRLSRERELIIASKNFDSNILLSEFVAQILESRNIKCVRWFPNGGTINNYACLKNAWIDLFIDYTGTGLQFFNIDHKNFNKDILFSELNKQTKRELHAEYLTPIGVSTDYCLVVSRRIADKEKVRSISDLSNNFRVRKKFDLVCSQEFLGRRDGLIGLKELMI